MRGCKLLLLATSTAFVCWGGARISLAAQQPSSPGPAARRAASTRRPPSIPIPRDERPILVAMATCNTAVRVNVAYSKIRRPDLVARIVLYTNLARLDPASRRAACGLLASMPKTGRQYDRLGALGGFLYREETLGDVKAVGQAYWQLSAHLAAALKLCPGYLAAFIAYGLVAIRNHQDEYPDWAARVCRSNPSRFLKAFETLSPRDRRYIAKYVIQPRGCKQIAIVAQ